MSQYVHIHDCAAANLTTTGYVEIIPSSGIDCSQVQFFFFITTAAFGLAVLAIGEEGFEEDVLLCSQKVGTAIPIYVQNGSRFSIKAIGSNITSGCIVLTLIP